MGEHLTRYVPPSGYHVKHENEKMLLTKVSHSIKRVGNFSLIIYEDIKIQKERVCRNSIGFPSPFGEGRARLKRQN